MTPTIEDKAPTVSELRPSPLPFDPAELTAVRVKPAEFARLVKVSKQTVSQWIKKGTITLGPDGRLDPAVAARQVFERSEPGKIRAKVFKTALQSMDALREELAAARARIEEVEAELVAEREFRARYTMHHDDLASHLFRLEQILIQSLDDLVAARQAGRLEHAIDCLVGLEFYGGEPEEFEDLEPPDDAAGNKVAIGEEDLFADLPDLERMAGLDSLDAP